jgi:hypothetical protein
MSMPSRLMRVALSAILVTLGAGRAAAQTVIVRHATPASDVVVQLNEEPPHTVTADARGEATVTLGLPADTPESTVRVLVDTCGSQSTVRLISPGLTAPAPEANCTRNDAGATFVIRPITSFVIDATSASVRVRQGRAPENWYGEEADQLGTGAGAIALPREGLSVYGGGGLAGYRHAVDVMCGAVSTCTASNARLGLEGGVAFWLTGFLGVEAAYVKPFKLKAHGDGTNYSFDSSRSAQLYTLAVNVGGRTHNVRLYGQAGANYHEATLTQTETIDDKTITVDGVDQVVTGGTQTFVLDTAGWGWLFGGGIEGWANGAVAIYAEGQYLQLLGNDINGGEGRMDDHMLLAMAGVRIRIGF